MKCTPRTPVIWVGDEGGETFERLAEVLARYGVAFEIAESVEQLRCAVERWPKAVVVVRDDEIRLGLDAALAALNQVCRPVTIVALMEEPAFGRYYDLMGRGVHYYYGLSEGADRIAHAVQHSAAHAA